MPDDSSQLDPQLLERYLADECTPAERQLVDAWAAADPAHANELARLRLAWRGWADARPAPSVDSAWARMADRLAERSPDARPPIRLVHPIPRAAPRRRFAVAIAMAAAVVIVAVGTIARWRAASPAAPPQEFASAAGVRTTVVLTDGTRLTLAPASHVQVPAAFGRGDRTVVLEEGEAAFQVRHDAAHPFAVRTVEGTVRDIGTTFVVRDYSSDHEMDVTVAEGRVSVAPADTVGGPLVLARNQRVRLVRGAAPVVAAVDANQYLAWTTGRLVFHDTPLRQVASELGRWYGLEVRLTDSTIGGLRLTTSFRDEPLDEVLDAVAGALRVRIDRQGHTVTIRRGA